jgi:hypothetical protein
MKKLFFLAVALPCLFVAKDAGAQAKIQMPRYGQHDISTGLVFVPTSKEGSFKKTLGMGTFGYQYNSKNRRFSVGLDLGYVKDQKSEITGGPNGLSVLWDFFCLITLNFDCIGAIDYEPAVHTTFTQKHFLVNLNMRHNWKLNKWGKFYSGASIGRMASHYQLTIDGVPSGDKRESKLVGNLTILGIATEGNILGAWAELGYPNKLGCGVKVNF